MPDDRNQPDLSRLRLTKDEKRPAVIDKRYIVGAIILLIFFIALLIWPRSVPKPVVQENKVEPKPVVSVENGVVAAGYVEAVKSAILYPAADGVVSEVYADVGSKVKKGDVLLRVDTRIREAEVAMASAAAKSAGERYEIVRQGARPEEINDITAQREAALANYNRESDRMKRMEGLVGEGLVSESDLSAQRFNVANLRSTLGSLEARERLIRQGNRPEEINAARSEYERLKASERQARETYGRSFVRAPFSGIITRVDLKPGEMVSVMSMQGGRSGIEITDISGYLIRIDVPQKSIGLVRVGAKAQIFIDVLPDKAFAGAVTSISPVANRQSNTVEVTVKIIDMNSLIRPNMSVRVNILGR